MVDGKPRIADFALADREWEASTFHERRPVSVDGDSPAAAPADGTDTAEEPNPAADYRAAQMRLTVAKAAREELELARERGKVVDAEAVAAAGAAVIVLVRNRLLGVPSKLRAQRPQLTTADVVAVDTLIRQALDDIGNTPLGTL